MQLKAIISAICDAFGDLAMDDVWADLVVLRGRRNFGDAEPGYAYEPGNAPVPLLPEMELPEQYLLFEEIGHYPLSCLVAFDSKAALEQALLDAGGYLNAFTTRVTCVIEGKVEPFDIFYRGPDGAERRFDKAEQLSLQAPFGIEYPSARLAWLRVDA